jgi:hypothetical protein
LTARPRREGSAEAGARGRAYASVAFLSAGTVLMFLGFFAYAGGASTVGSIAVVLLGLGCEVSGFSLAYAGYKAALRRDIKKEETSAS